jgi:transposase
MRLSSQVLTSALFHRSVYCSQSVSPLTIRDPAKVSRHLQLRLETQPKVIQDLRWKAQVRLCKRYRRLVSRGKHPNVVTVAMARELAGFMWAMAKQVPVTPSSQDA